MKNFSFLVLGLAGCMSLSAYAQEYQFPGGSGTKADPYQVKTAEDLNHVRDFATNSEINFIQMNDIDLTDFIGEGSWQAICAGGTDAAFEGTYDCGNYTIYGLKVIGGTNGGGLFGRVQKTGVLKNINIRNAELDAGDWSGILVSTNGNWEEIGGDLINCHVYDSEIYGGNDTGGLAGVNGGNITNCSVVGTVVEANSGVGGIVGNFQIAGNKGSKNITNTYFSGTVTGAGNTGGVIGFTGGSSEIGNIENCAVYGSVTTSGSGVSGGIVAYAQGMGGQLNLINCYCGADVTGYQAGGIGGSPVDATVKSCYMSGNVLAVAGADVNWSGGITGTSYFPIEGSYFSGSVSGPADAKLGGISGRNWDIVVKNCYYNSDGAKMNMGEGNDESKYEAKGLLPEEMMSFSTMPFTDAARWKVQEGKTMPYFANQTEPITITSMTTTGATGTYSGTLDDLVFYNSYGALNPASVEIANGTWSVTWEPEALFEQEIVFAFGKANDKDMPSQLVSMEAVMGGVEAVADSSDAIRVAVSDGLVKIFANDAAAMDYQFVSISGAVVKSGATTGNVTEVATSDLATGAYILVVGNTKAKVLVK